ncbi:MAG: type I-E CRISPR-associated protein Cas5/CasD [Thiothrix sp.]|nr:type I-E CRISPR-associated protein Cas5/CasD [Thiothrix sp.]
MQSYLVFQLYAPLVSWGDQAVGQERPGTDHPSRSALLGLIGAALGLKRDDDAGQAALAADCHFGTRLYAPGLTLRDFHTVQVPASSKKVQSLYTRRDELSGPKARLGTLLSFRSYQQDSFSVAALWLENTSRPPQWTLDTICQALQQPHFPLYLGRKSCPPALPLNPQALQADRLQAALDQYQPAEAMQHLLHRNRPALDYWEYSDHIGMQGRETHRVPRHDQPLNRRRWQFSSREEYVALVKGEADVPE